MNQLTPVVIDRMPAPVVAAGESASYRCLEFFTAQIRNPSTRRAYARAAVESVHIAAYIEQLQKARSAPTAKLRLAALRHLLDWMVFLIVGAVALLALAPPCEAKKTLSRRFQVHQAESAVQPPTIKRTPPRSHRAPRRKTPLRYGGSPPVRSCPSVVSSGTRRRRRKAAPHGGR